MFEKDIENAFTAKVAKYLADGYIFNLATMNGSQGEYGKVDLCKGMMLFASCWKNGTKEILRFML